MARELSYPAAAFLGGSIAIGLSSIFIAIIDHKQATARGEKTARKTKLRPFDYVLLVGAATYAVFETVDILEEAASL